jgi:hypothetical protein
MKQLKQRIGSTPGTLSFLALLEMNKFKKWSKYNEKFIFGKCVILIEFFIITASLVLTSGSLFI